MSGQQKSPQERTRLEGITASGGTATKSRNDSAHSLNQVENIMTPLLVFFSFFSLWKTGMNISFIFYTVRVNYLDGS